MPLPTVCGMEDGLSASTATKAQAVVATWEVTDLSMLAV